MFQRSDGRWCGQFDVGVDATGARQRRVVYGWTRDEVIVRMASPGQARQQRDKGRRCERCGRTFPAADIFRGRCGGCYPWAQPSPLGVTFAARPTSWSVFDCRGCGAPTWTSTVRDVCLGCESAGQPVWRVREERMARARQRGTHTDVEWAGLCAAWDHRCAYCGTAGRLTKDHVRAVVLGGSDLIENITPACIRCNKSKGYESAQSFVARRRCFA